MKKHLKHHFWKNTARTLICTLLLSTTVPTVAQAGGLTEAPPAGAAGAVGGAGAGATVPAAPGTLLSKSPVTDAIPGLGNAFRITYASTTTEGDPTTVTGFLIEPTTAWQGPGPQPTLVMAPGTRGQAEICGPSGARSLIGDFDPKYGSLNINYELPQAYAAAAKGLRVVMTDYMGLQPHAAQIHRYVNTLDAAHAVLDAGRAALKAGDLPPNSPILFYGYSQGGGAVAAAAENLPDYAPDLNLKGSFAGAPPADLQEVIPVIDGTAIMGVLAYALGGMRIRDHAAYEAVVKYFNPHGLEVIDQVAHTCVPDMAARFGFKSTREFTTDGSNFADIMAREPEVRAYLERQRIGKKPLSTPMLVVSGRYDDIVPFAQARTMAENFCKSGGQVFFFTDETLPVPGGIGVNHLAPKSNTWQRAMDYLIGRLDPAQEVPVNCGAF